MPTHAIPASYHDRILDVARRLGGDIGTCNETIRAIPAAEPTRIRAALRTVLPAQVVVTATLERRLLLGAARGPRSVDRRRSRWPGSPHPRMAIVGTHSYQVR